MESVDAFIAVNRFGLGAAPGELAEAARDPRGWVERQITDADPLPEALKAFPSSQEMMAKVHNARLDGQQRLQQVQPVLYRQFFFREVYARTLAMAHSQRPFRERMVAFWSNHFTVSIANRLTGSTSAAYEREAIRPHVFGRFEDMLLAVAHHPTMLAYLNNDMSIGPGSKVGEKLGRGLNENLAREILELHTLGVHGGYSQADVTEFARILTGWTHGGIQNRQSMSALGPIHGRFVFREEFHDSGSKTLLGRRYAEDGEDEGISALKTLARHPSTARHIATKLVRHFVADDTPADAVAAIEDAFKQSDGDLAAVSRALVRLDAAWRDPLPKVKTPYEMVLATFRAAQVRNPPFRPVIGSLRQLGQIPFNAASPAGWPDTAKDWISPEALIHRIEWLRAVSARLPRNFAPSHIAAETVGPVEASHTREMVAAAPSGDAALAMIFASPEFQRR